MILKSILKFFLKIFSATKKGESIKNYKITSLDDDKRLNQPYGLKHKLVQRVNSIQSLWKAGVYEEYANLTIRDTIKRAGGKKHFSRVLPRYQGLKYIYIFLKNHN